MSLQGLNELDKNWTLRNTLTINNDVEVKGDLNTTGFIYDGGVPVNIQASNNVWTGENLFSLYQPTFLAPTTDDEMATYDYMDTAFTGIGSSLLPLNNTWTGANNFSQLPTITNAATAGTNEAVNKSVVDTYISASTGNLGTTNTWTGANTFQNKTIVPTPTTDYMFGNKGYVDSAISAFNASGGKVEMVESVSSGYLFSCDPAIYSGCIFCVVSGGGYGINVNPPAPTGQNIKSFGGSGGFCVFKVPAYSGNATFSQTTNTYTSVGSCSLTLPNGTQVCSITCGTNGSSSASGTGGVVTLNPIFSGAQIITGSTEPLQNPITNDAITRSYNIGVLNRRGEGGSYNYTTGANTSCSGGYCLQIKFKN